MLRTLLLLTVTLVSALPAAEHDERAIFAASIEPVTIRPTFITITRQPTATFDPCPTVTVTTTTTTTKTVTVKPTVLPTIAIIRPTRTLIPHPTYTIGPVDPTFIAYDEGAAQE